MVCYSKVLKGLGIALSSLFTCGGLELDSITLEKSGVNW